VIGALGCHWHEWDAPPYLATKTSRSVIPPLQAQSHDVGLRVQCHQGSETTKVASTSTATMLRSTKRFTSSLVAVLGDLE
jgi:hypothetical protein